MVAAVPNPPKAGAAPEAGVAAAPNPLKRVTRGQQRSGERGHYPTVGATAAVGVEVAAPVPNPKLGAADVLAGGAPRENPPDPPAGAVLAPNENVISGLESLLLSQSESQI